MTWNETPPEVRPLQVADTALDEARLNHAQEDHRDLGDKIFPDAQQAILQRKILLGLTPYECHLAGGAFQYGVEADSSWPANTDPLKIMWAQSILPDDSKIFMIFQTGTQYQEEGLAFFRVDFERGVAVRITKQPGGQPQ